MLCHPAVALVFVSLGVTQALAGPDASSSYAAVQDQFEVHYLSSTRDVPDVCSEAGLFYVCERRLARGQAICAAWVPHILTLLEDHADLAQGPSTRLESASAAFHSARQACAAGRFTEAFALFTSIDLERIPADELPVVDRPPALASR